MTVMFFFGALLAGLFTAVAAGALSGLRIGKEALGAELAAYMGGVYGFISGLVAVGLGLIIMALI